MTKHAKKGAGGKRANSGRKKNENKLVSMEVKLPKEDKKAVKEKYGRTFNQVFRDWIKTLITK